MRKDLLVWCLRCDAGYAALGDPVPPCCPRCESPADPWWTLTPPYTLTGKDRDFLKANRILAD